MNHVYLLAPAKINLYLEIVGNRPDGYHELLMLMQSIELSDLLEFRLTGIEDIRLYCQHPQVPTDQSNLIYKAVNLVKQKFPSAYNNFGGMDITLNKKIPIAAGVAGGSGNAAATLVGLNLLWRLGLTENQLKELGAQLGSDVPFSLVGGTALASGRGEKIDSLPPLENLWLVLAKYESLGVSTIWAYQAYRQQFSSSYRQPDALERQGKINFLRSKLEIDSGKLGEILHNDLEKVVLPSYPQVQQLKEIMQKAGGLGTMMSGSGPSVFTLCRSQEEAEKIKQQTQIDLKNPDLKLWVTRLVNQGVQMATNEHIKS